MTEKQFLFALGQIDSLAKERIRGLETIQTFFKEGKLTITFNVSKSSEETSWEDYIDIMFPIRCLVEKFENFPRYELRIHVSKRS